MAGGLKAIMVIMALLLVTANFYGVQYEIPGDGCVADSPEEVL